MTQQNQQPQPALAPAEPMLFSVAWFDQAIAANQANADQQEMIWHKTQGVVEALKAQREMAVQAELKAQPQKEPLPALDDTNPERVRLD